MVPRQIVLICPAWCEAEHTATASADLHTRELLNAGPLFVGLEWSPGQRAGVVVEATGPALTVEEASRLGAAVTRGVELLACRDIGRVVAFTQTAPTPAELSEALSCGLIVETSGEPEQRASTGIAGRLRYDRRADDRLILDVLSHVAADDIDLVERSARLVLADPAPRQSAWTVDNAVDTDRWFADVWL